MKSKYRRFFLIFLPLFITDPVRADDPAVINNQAGLPPTQENKSLFIAPQLSGSFPQPLQIGAELQSLSLPALKAYGAIGFFQYPFTGGDRSLNTLSARLGARYFPNQNWYFGSAGFGYRTISFNANLSSFTIDNQVLATTDTITLRTFFFELALGTDFKLSKALSLGFDVGVQIPLIASAQMNLVNANTGQNSSNSSLLAVDSSPMTRIAGLLLPELTFFRLTWHLE